MEDSDVSTVPLDGVVSPPLRGAAWPVNAAAIVAGATFTVAYPFVRDTFDSWENDGEGNAVTVPMATWKPGVRFEPNGPEDTEAVADALGRMTLTVIDAFKPGRFPRRVFYTRQFTTPEGRPFGKGGLRIKTLDAFRRIAKGYYHEFRLANAVPRAPRPNALAESKKMFAEALGVPEASLDFLMGRPAVERERARGEMGSGAPKVDTPERRKPPGE